MYEEQRGHSYNHQDSNAFICGHCKRTVPAGTPGTRHRNHCPWCLWSRHLDERTGDRKSACYGQMEPIAIWVKEDGEWSIVHRCQSCSTVRLNRIAGDDSELTLLSLAVQPLARPPFPLEYVVRDMNR
jgi:hypothetical protein